MQQELSIGSALQWVKIKNRLRGSCLAETFIMYFRQTRESHPCRHFSAGPSSNMIPLNMEEKNASFIRHICLSTSPHAPHSKEQYSKVQIMALFNDAGVSLGLPSFASDKTETLVITFLQERKKMTSDCCGKQCNQRISGLKAFSLVYPNYNEGQCKSFCLLHINSQKGQAGAFFSADCQVQLPRGPTQAFIFSNTAAFR